MTKKYQPRLWQPIITNYVMNHPRCGLFVPMGMGKSVAVLTALQQLHMLGKLDHPVLVIAPLRVARTTWPDEIATWEHLSDVVCVPILGSASQREEVLRRYLPRKGRAERRLQVFTINYDNVDWLVKKLGLNWPFRTVVADELPRLKGFRTRQGAKRAKALAAVAWPYKDKKANLHTLVERFIGLTGTPSPNGLADLWGQIYFLDKGERMGKTFTAFEERWFTRGFDGFSIKPLPHAQNEIENLLKDVCLAIRAEDYIAVDKPVVNVISVELPHKAREKYCELEKQMYTELENLLGDDHEVEAVNAAALTVKCLQIASGAAYVGEDNKEWVEVHDGKIEALRSVVEEAAGMPVLVAYHFRSDLARLQRAFPQGRVLDNNPDTISDWNAGKVPILFAHPASAGHGLSLQHGSNILVFFSVWWDMEQHMQIIERIGPMRQMQSGYNRPVFVHYLLARDTIDETVKARLEEKGEVQELLLQAMARKKDVDSSTLVE